MKLNDVIIDKIYDQYSVDVNNIITQYKIFNIIKRGKRMFNKQVIVTDHAKERFVERDIKFRKGSKRNRNSTISIEQQIIEDLRPLNVREIIKLNNEGKCIGEKQYKVITNQGKVYIVVVGKEVATVETVYKIDIKEKLMSDLAVIC